MATQPDDLTLATEFPAASHEAWLKLVDKVLAGAPFEKKLVGRTYDGLAIQPLYTRADWDADGDPSGFPGAAPYTRGGRVLGTAQNGWDIRQRHSHPDPEVANHHILEDLERGVTSIALQVDPTGRQGVCIRSRTDLDAALKGVLLDLAPVALRSAYTLPLAALMIGALRRGRVKGDAFHGNFGSDPLTSLASTGRLNCSVDEALARTADLATYVARAFPNARALNVGTVAYHSAGAAEAQELGCGIAAAVSYLRALTAAGLDIDTACGQVAFTVTADADMLLSIAKIRALRRLWGRVAEACGASVERRVAPITAITAPRMYTKRDPWVNILRGTIACFAAGIAGAEAITVLPLDHALGTASALSRRVARNTQVVLQEESGLARVIDPAGGAWTFEKLTDDLANAAWAFFQKIEKAGGLTRALTSGLIAQEIGAVREARLANVAKRKDPLTGLSEFPNLHEAPIQAETFDFAAVLRNRDPRPVGNVDKLPAPGKGALVTAMSQAAKSGANLLALRQALGGKPTKAVTALSPIRLGQDFEALRDAGEAYKWAHGAWPKIFLACLGTVAEFTARGTFAKNFFEAGGIDTVTGTGGTDAHAIAADFRRTGAPLAIVCGPDALYAEQAAPLAKALKTAGADAVLLAGRPAAEKEAEFRAAGIDGFIFIGCDVPAVLKDLHQRLAA